MVDFRPTPQQEQAIHNRGGALLVSAAAGSGKTKVLVERLFTYMEQEGCCVDDFLVIAYNNASAAELRHKIARELMERIARCPDDLHLRGQLMRVYRAEIKTVDAFCAALLRQNTHLLGAVEGRSLTPDFRVLEEGEARTICARALQRVMDRFYERLEKGDERARLLAETLGFGRDDRKLEGIATLLHDKIQSHSRPEEWLRQTKEGWETPTEEALALRYGQLVMDHTAGLARFWANQLEREARELEDYPEISGKYAPFFTDMAAQLRRYQGAAAQGWAAMGEAEPVFPDRLRAVTTKDEDVKAKKEQASKLWKDCRELFRNQIAPIYRVPLSEYLEDVVAMAPAMIALLELTEELSQTYRAEKVRRNCADFSDLEHYALSLLLDEAGRPTELADQLSRRFREVMVDEYQDSNEVQNSIYYALSNQGRKLFCVGDMKQSIYRFRLADPGIFLRKYNDYPEARAGEQMPEGMPRKVILQTNFRSRARVLEAVNFLFSGVMSPAVGEIAYTEQEELHYGSREYLPCGDTDTEFHLVSLEEKGDEPEEQAESGAEVEARFVARQIRQMLDEGYPVQDRESFRPVKAEDIVILARAHTSLIRHYAAALAGEGVPFAGVENRDFFSAVEIVIMRCFLEIIDNPRQDVPLISVMRSPLFGFTADRLAQIRSLRTGGSFYSAVMRDEGEDTKRFCEKLRALRWASRDLTVDGLLWRLYTDCDALAVFGAMEDGARRKDNLLALLTYAGREASAGRSGLFAFLVQLRSQEENESRPKISAGNSARGVRLMSIHKSKGLEFPVVFLVNLNRQFNQMDLKSAVLIHPQLGLGPKRVDLERRIRYDTLTKMGIARQLERELLSEEMRLLYVAMTRAREKLILVDCVKDARAYIKKRAIMASYPAEPDVVARCKSMGEWVLLPLLCSCEGAALCQWAGAELATNRVEATGWQVRIWDDPAAWTVSDALKQRVEPGEKTEQEEQEEQGDFDPGLLTFDYGHREATRIPTKISATQLKGREMDRELAEGGHMRPPELTFAMPRFLRDGHILTGAERGTAMHLAMQYVDFSRPDETAVAAQVEELCGRRLMTPEQAAAVDCAAVSAFLHSPLGRRIAGAETLYREYRFALLVSAGLYDPAVEGEELLLQGVVDCAFDTPEGLVIVDFKTDRVAPGEEAGRAEDYRPQLEAYSRALEQVLERPVAERWLYFFYTGREIPL